MKLMTCLSFSFNLQPPMHFKHTMHYTLPIPQAQDFPSITCHLSKRAQNHRSTASALPSASRWSLDNMATC